MQLPGTIDIVGVLAGPGNESPVFLAPNGGADPVFRHRFNPYFQPIARHLSAHGTGACLYSLDDVLVASATAQVTLEPLANFLVVRIGILFHEVERAHDHARRAETALQAVMLAKRFLHRVQLAVFRQALDSQDVRTFSLHGQHRATLDGTTVDVDDAGAALTRIATDVRTGEPQLVAYHLDEQYPVLYLCFDRVPVQNKGNFRRHGLFLSET
jgi:hypothetical protein